MSAVVSSEKKNNNNTSLLSTKKSVVIQYIWKEYQTNIEVPVVVIKEYYSSITADQKQKNTIRYNKVIHSL